MSSLERFVGILIEHYSGNLPLWLSPVQVILLNITDKQREYTSSLNDQLQGLGLRSECDLSNEKIGYKIRNHAMTRVPYMIIIGDKELLITDNNHVWYPSHCMISNLITYLFIT